MSNVSRHLSPVVKYRRGVPLERKILTRSVRDGECLRWTGSHNPKGYGQVCHEGRVLDVHRAAHELWVGPIPDGLEVDHVAARGCRHRDCVEPAHLEAVTHAENLRRKAEITHCPRGHEFSEANTRWATNDRGYRVRKCRACPRERVACEVCGTSYTRRNRAAHERSSTHRSKAGER